MRPAWPLSLQTYPSSTVALLNVVDRREEVLSNLLTQFRSATYFDVQSRMKDSGGVDLCLEIYIGYRSNNLGAVCFVHPQLIEAVQDE